MRVLTIKDAKTLPISGGKEMHTRLIAKAMGLRFSEVAEMDCLDLAESDEEIEAQLNNFPAIARVDGGWEVTLNHPLDGHDKVFLRCPKRKDMFPSGDDGLFGGMITLLARVVRIDGLQRTPAELANLALGDASGMVVQLLAYDRGIDDDLR